MAPSARWPLQTKSDDVGQQEADGLAEHRGLGLDPAHSPAQHAQAVDHGRVAVGAHQGVRVGQPPGAVPDPEHDAGQVLEVHLVDDPGVRWHDAEVLEGVLAPAQEGVALAVPLELLLGVDLEGRRPAERIDLHGVVDDQLGGEERVDAARGAPQVRHGVPHGGEVHDGGDSREVLEEDACGPKRDLPLLVAAVRPRGHGADVIGRDRVAVLVPEEVLEQDPDRIRQAGDARDARALERAQVVVGDPLALDLQRGAGSEAVQAGGPCARGRPLAHGSLSPSV